MLTPGWEGWRPVLIQTMSAARGVLSQDSPLMVELENALKEISAMSRSIRQLSNYLDQIPRP